MSGGCARCGDEKGQAEIPKLLPAPSRPRGVRKDAYTLTPLPEILRCSVALNEPHALPLTCVEV